MLIAVPPSGTAFVIRFLAWTKLAQYGQTIVFLKPCLTFKGRVYLRIVFYTFKSV